MQFQDKASNCKSAKGIEELQKWESYVIELVFLEREFWYLKIDVQCGKKRPHMHGDKMWKIDWHQNNTQKDCEIDLTRTKWYHYQNEQILIRNYYSLNSL